MARGRRFLSENSLSVFFFVLFALTVVGQSFAGWLKFNDEQTVHGEPTVSFARFIGSSGFGADLLENWQSEWLQFWVFALATVWLIQKGSNESKTPEDAGLEDDEKQQVGQFAVEDSPRWARVKDWRLHLYSNSFVIVMGVVFLATWIAQSFAAWTVYNDEQRTHEQPSVSWSQYFASSDFWERSLQNWQSEFLAVGTMVVFTIYLRQRGSPESKPVGAPHHETASSG
ncbi:MAG: hypothetical protein H0V79_08430 [Actinobacteria bacterium]|nr:hypothetical protein [Actinomycetota bacterium]